MMDLPACLRALSDAAGAGGQSSAADAAERFLKETCDTVERDALGSLTGWLRCGRESAPVLMLEAHLDEIGLIVTRVDGDGFVRVAPCGGVDRRTLAAAEVVVYGDKPYPGVFCSTPPHLRKKDDRLALPEIDEMGIDTGMDEAQAKKHVHPGDRVGFRPHFRRLNDNRVTGKSLDNRAGMAAVLVCLDLLKKGGRPLPWDIAAVFAVQEELGARGAAAAAHRVRPDFAVAVDVSFAVTPDADKAKCGELGKGPMIGWSPTLDDRMTQELAALAIKHGIPVQDEVMGGETGTDAESISDARSGVRTALLSIPLRYMHTPAEVVDLRDVENTGRLMAALAAKGADAL